MQVAALTSRLAENEEKLTAALNPQAADVRNPPQGLQDSNSR